MATEHPGVDAYIAGFDPDVQQVLRQVRATIRAAAPQATEKISYQMPTFWQRRNLIHFAAFKTHLSIFPGGQAPAHFAERLAGLDWDKGTIRFPWGRPVDLALIADITRYRVEVETAPR
jgi:uncharacterized protein YdhG (YjbR/CyaY superfamily)